MNGTSINARIQLMKDGKEVGEIRDGKSKAENTLADSVRLNYTSVGACTFENLQLEINSVATEYEPNTKRAININKPLASVDDTMRDIYYVKDGKKYHKQLIKEVIYDGSDDETWSTDGNNNYFYAYASGLDLKPNSKLLCDKAYYIDQTPNGPNQCHATSVIAIGCDRSVYPTPTEFKNYLKTNPHKFLYELAAPITTEIETEDMQTFDGQTNITTTNTVKPTLDIDIPSDLNAVVSNLMVENTSLKQENQALTSELESQKAINEENTMLMNTILGV